MNSLEGLVGKTHRGWVATRVVVYKGKRIVVGQHPCGREKKFRSQKEFLNNSQACIRCQKNTHTPLEAIYSIYVKNAQTRGIEFNLNIHDFYFMIKQDCFYCGQSPSIQEKGRWVSESWHKSFYRNGLDRIEPEAGYTDSNVVPCCFRCNQLKGNLGFEDFIGLIEQIYKKLSSPKQK